MRTFSTALAGAAGLLLVLPAGMPAASAAPADGCLQDPQIGYNLPRSGDWVPILTTKDEVADLHIWGPTKAQCPDVSVTVARPDGSRATVVALSTDVPASPADFPPGIAGDFGLRLADSAGDWVITKVTSGSASLALNHRFTVRRGTVVTFDQPATVTSPAKSTFTGTVRHYSPTGTLVAAAGRPVLVETTSNTPIASAVADSAGRFRAQRQLIQNLQLRVDAATTTAYSYSYSVTRVAGVRAALVKLSASPTAKVGQWWKVTGQILPGSLWTALQIWNGSSWVSTGSFGNAASDGTFARWWKPTAAGTYRLRLQLGSGAQVNTPLYRELTISVSR